MLKKINRVLKLVGLNLVRAKGPRRKSNWQAVPPVPRRVRADHDGHTHYVGDDCPGGHREEFASIRSGTENVALGYLTTAHVVNPDANFVPVDIGADDHEITRTEHGVCPVTHFHGCCCVKCIEEVDKPRVQQPNSDNKVNGPSS